MTVTWCALRGSVRYEARMAARGRVLWLSLLPLTALAVLLALTSPTVTGLADPGRRVGTTVIVVNIFAVVGLGVAMAGRLVQHARRGLTDVLDTTPGGRTARLTGVFAGALAVALAPIAAAVLLLGVVASAQAGSVTPLLTAALGVVTVLVPAALVISTFAGLLGLLLPVALARVLVVGVWFWATVLNPSIVPVPTPTGTVLSPLGGYQAVAWLGVRAVWANGQRRGVLSPPPSAGAAVLNLLTVLMLALVFFLCTRAALAWRAAGHEAKDGDDR